MINVILFGRKEKTILKNFAVTIGNIVDNLGGSSSLEDVIVPVSHQAFSYCWLGQVFSSSYRVGEI